MKDIINSESSLADIKLKLGELFDKHKWLMVSIKAGTRTDKQNAWIYKAYEMLSKQGDVTPLEYRAYCKHKFGLIILSETYEERVNILRQMYQCVSYENWLKFMIDEPVTSLFDVDQGLRYINEIINHYSGFDLPRKDFDK